MTKSNSRRKVWTEKQQDQTKQISLSAMNSGRLSNRAKSSEKGGKKTMPLQPSRLPIHTGAQTRTQPK